MIGFFVMLFWISTQSPPAPVDPYEVLSQPVVFRLIAVPQTPELREARQKNARLEQDVTALTNRKAVLKNGLKACCVMFFLCSRVAGL